MSSYSQNNPKTWTTQGQSWVILPQGKAAKQKMKIVQGSKWRSDMRVLGGLAFALDVASECRWSHRWLIFISQVPKTHPGGKSFLKPIGLENSVPHCSTKQWLWPSVYLKRHARWLVSVRFLVEAEEKTLHKSVTLSIHENIIFPKCNGNDFFKSPRHLF